MEQFINFEDSELSDKEQKILNSACLIFSQKGYSATTTNEIAKNAGVSEGTIFRYFKTKKHILHGLLLKLVEILADRVAIPPIEKILLNADNKTTQQVIKEIILDRMKLVDKNFELFKVIISEALFHDDIREIFKEKLIDKVSEMFERYHNTLVGNGSIKDFPSNIVLTSVVGNIFMFIFTKKIFCTDSDKSKIDNEIDMIIDIILNGIGKKQ